jgi:hypothetical protein
LQQAQGPERKEAERAEQLEAQQDLDPAGHQQGAEPVRAAPARQSPAGRRKAEQQRQVQPQQAETGPQQALCKSGLTQEHGIPICRGNGLSLVEVL